MDTGTLSVMIVVLFTLIVLGAFFVYRQRIKTSIKGPFGTSLDVEGSNDSPILPPARSQFKTGNITSERDTEFTTQRGDRDIEMGDIKSGRDTFLRDEVALPDTDPNSEPPE